MFILSEDIAQDDPMDAEGLRQAYQSYRDYLKRNRFRFSRDTYDLAVAQSYESTTERCQLHGSRVVSIDLFRPQSGEASMELVVVGPFEDVSGHVRYQEPGDVALLFDTQDDAAARIYRSEFALTETRNLALHSIEFLSGRIWTLTARSINCVWSDIRIGEDE